jgi:hypothetical protein
MLALKNAIKCKPSNGYAVAHLSKAINQLLNKFGSTFSTTGVVEFHIFFQHYHMDEDSPTEQIKKQTHPYFWVQVANLI